MTAEICDNCGLTEKEHPWENKSSDYFITSCKKFKPKTEGDKTLSNEILEYGVPSGGKVIPVPKVKNFIKELLESPDFDDEDKAFIKERAGKNLI